jgi:hypothetical protein
MNDYTTPPRRPIVPGPSGIAAKAVTLRERLANAKPGGGIKVSPEEFAEIRTIQMMPTPVHLPVTSVGKLSGAIAGVMSEIGTIKKGGYNAFHKYHYARMEDLLEALTPLMGRHGIAVFQNELEIKTIENRIAITYEFTVGHTSNESMQGLRQTGMCIARNSKGDYDDKAINKCHTQARKYFLLSLFQVPTGDFEEADEGPPKESEQPKQAGPRTVPGPPPAPAPEPVSPYKIIVPKGCAPETWLAAYLQRINEAKDADEIAKLDHYNDMILQSLNDKHPGLYNQIAAVVTDRLAQLPVSEDTMPDPVEDTQGSMNWVATKLAQQTSQENLEAFWNLTVAPHEVAFDDMDWSLLLQEFRRHEARLAVPSDDEPETA